MTTATKSLDLATVAETLGSKRLSFSSADKLLQLLGIQIGSLSPFALVNDISKDVRLVMDSELADEPMFLFHPLENNASVSLSRSALDDFLVSIDHPADWQLLTARAAS